MNEELKENRKWAAGPQLSPRSFSEELEKYKAYLDEIYHPKSSEEEIKKRLKELGYIS